jgi:hypothetical protein
MEKEQIKILAFKDFLRRLADHPRGECMDIVPHQGFSADSF